MTVPSNNVDTGSALIIPDAHCLVVAGGQYPRQFMMEKGRSYIIDVALHRKHASLLLVIPYFY
jgi:hypothetical protein